jgi:hypothetical protein
MPKDFRELRVLKQTLPCDYLRGLDPNYVANYRIRIIDNQGIAAFDIRQYIESPNFTGWTRRGLRIWCREDVENLQDILTEVLESDELPTREEAVEFYERRSRSRRGKRE